MISQRPTMPTVQAAQISLRSCKSWSHIDQRHTIGLICPNLTSVMQINMISQRSTAHYRFYLSKSHFGPADQHDLTTIKDAGEISLPPCESPCSQNEQLAHRPTGTVQFKRPPGNHQFPRKCVLIRSFPADRNDTKAYLPAVWSIIASALCCCEL